MTERIKNMLYKHRKLAVLIIIVVSLLSIEAALNFKDCSDYSGNFNNGCNTAVLQSKNG